MRVVSLTIGGFRNIKKSRVTLRHITALVSLNNYGKSNFLEGIAFALEFLHSGEADRSKLMRNQGDVPLNFALIDEPFFFEIEVHEPTLAAYQFIRYGFSFVWYRDDAARQVISDEWLDMRPTQSVKYTRYLKRHEGRYRKGKDTNAFRNLSLGRFQLSLDVLSSFEDLDYHQAVEAIKGFAFATYPPFDSEDQVFNRGYRNVSPKSLGTSFVRKLSSLLNDLKYANPERWELFRESIFVLFPEIIALEVIKATFDVDYDEFLEYSNARRGGELSYTMEKTPPYTLRNDIYRIVVVSRTMNQPIDISLLSSGTQRVFWILALLFSSDRNTHVIGIEELEANIHPRLLKQMLEILYENLGDTALIITSHSPYLVQYLPLEGIHLGLPNENGVAEFSGVAATKIRALVKSARNNGMSVAEYVFDLMSSDTRTMDILRRFVKVDGE